MQACSHEETIRNNYQISISSNLIIFFTLIVKNVHMKANILRIFSSFLIYNKHAKFFVQRWHQFWSSKIDHYFTKQRISIKNVDVLSLCKVGHFVIDKNPYGIICSIVLKKKGKNNTAEELSPLRFFQSRKSCEFMAVTIEILLYLPDTSRFYLTRGICNGEMFRLLQNTVVIHIAYSFILC